MITMSKKNKILLGILLIVYVITLVIFHATYKYRAYWEEESSLIIRYSVYYIVIGMILYLIFNRTTINALISNISLKRLTRIIAFASIIKAALCFLDGYLFQGFPILLTTVGWIVISVFFFTLHKNMQ